MRKNQTLFTMALLVLLGSMGAAQAQILSPRSSCLPPRRTSHGRGVKMRRPVASSSMLLPRMLSRDGATIMLHFSVPLAADIAAVGNRRRPCGVTVTGDTNAVVTGMAENEDNDGNGTITIDPGRQPLA